MSDKIRYKVSITEFTGEGEKLAAQSRYEQTVDQIDVRAIIAAVNAKSATEAPKVVRRRARRSDAGKPRAASLTPVEAA